MENDIRSEATLQGKQRESNRYLHKTTTTQNDNKQENDIL